MLAKRPKKYVLVRKETAALVPPLYVPHPDSVLPHRRCARVGCREVIPLGSNQCFVCGCRMIDTEPLRKFTIYVEEVQK
jgi:hypothetical protein